MVREDVSFESGGLRCAAWLYRPEGPGPHPAIVMAHGLGGVRHMRLDAYADRFRAAGFVVLLFDYRHWGDSEGEPRQLLDIGRQLDDWRAAFRFARDLDDVDPERVGLWGTSFAGGHVIKVAADEPEVAAVVSQCPFTDGIASMRVLPTKSLVRLTPDILRDQMRGWRGREPHYLPLTGPPGSKAAMTTPDSEPGYAALTPPDAPWENEHTPRFGLRLGTYRPGRNSSKVRCPLLMCVCEHDQPAPAKPAIKAAERAPHGELKTYPIGHFEIYWNEWFERAVADQLDFLTRHLSSGGEGEGQDAEQVAAETRDAGEAGATRA